MCLASPQALFAAGFLALAASSGCSTTRLALEPIEGLRQLPLSYRTSWEQSALEAGSAAPAAADNSAATRVRVRFVNLSSAESEAMLGSPGARPVALEVKLQDVEGLFAAMQAQGSKRVFESSTLAIAPDQPGELRVASQCAYIAAFQLSQTPEQAIADPIIEVTEDGCLLRLFARPSSEAGTLELSVDLALCELERPIQQREIVLAGGLSPLTVQVPANFKQRIQTDASLSGERALVIAGIPAREAGQTLMVVLTRD